MNRFRVRPQIVAATFAFTLLSLGIAARADADYFNLTTAGATATIDGAIFIQGETGSGTGVFPAFVQVTGNDPVHEAYNTTENNVLDNGSSPTFNHELLLSGVGEALCPTLGDPTRRCYEFLLDINENNGKGGGPNAGADADKYLSLDALQIYVGGTANLSTTTLADLGTLIYDMDANGDNTVGLDFNLASGSGTGDMRLLLPKDWFPAENLGLFVYLYSQFGLLGTITFGDAGTLPSGNYGASDGFEEWANGLNPDSPDQQCTNPDGCDPLATPEPASIALMGTGLAAIAVRLRRRRAEKRAEKV